MGTKEIDILTVQDLLDLTKNESLWLSDILFNFPCEVNSISCSFNLLSTHNRETIIELKPNLPSNEVIINELIELIESKPQNKLLFCCNETQYNIYGYDKTETNNECECVFLLINNFH